jgi:mannonate dehydratase
MSDNRRDFIKKSIALAAVSAGGIGSALSNPMDAETKERMEYYLALQKKKSTIRIIMQPNARLPANQMKWYRQMGIEDVTVWIDPPNDTAQYYIDTKKHFADGGINVYCMGDSSVHNQDKIVLNLPGRDAKIEEYKRHLQHCGAAGVTYTTYAHMGNGIWDTGTEATRGGAMARQFNQYGPNYGRWNALRFYPPLSHGRVYTEEELWENWKYFIRQVAPVAEENNVRIGIHPDDPPIPILAGVPRLFSRFERYKKALEIANSPNVGLCLCVGSWMEGGDTTGASPVEMIEHFGAQNKIFKIHFRNIEMPIPHFIETFVDSGYTNMYTIMKALKKINFDGVLFPDHVPNMAGGNAWPFSVGYVKALRDRVEAEALV